MSVLDGSGVRERILQEALAEAGFRGEHVGTARPGAWAHLLATVPLFADLGKRDLRRVARAAQICHLSEGRQIVREGFNAEAFYILLTGHAAVVRGGTEIAVLTAGDYFGELGLLDGSPRTATVVARCDLWAVKLPRGRFLALVDDEPAIARGLLATLAHRLWSAEYPAAPPPA